MLNALIAIHLNIHLTLMCFSSLRVGKWSTEKTVDSCINRPVAYAL